MRVPAARRLLAIACDVAGTLSLVALLFLAAGGSVKGELIGLRVSLTHGERPLRVFLATVLLVVLFDLTDGLYGALARRRIPVLSPLGAAVHRLERSLRHGYLRSRTNVAVSLLAIALTLGAVELGLRLFTALLPHRVGNYLAFAYDDRPHGIFRFDPEMNMLLMRPHYEREMYFNGYRWHHKTDWMGFRNPVDRTAADVVLLGDSMIYGHGVEETSTVRHHLEQALGRPVANLGMQGAGIHQEYQVLKRFGVPLAPRYVFLFFLVNDIFDLTTALTDRDMERLLALPVEDHTIPYFDIQPPYKPSMRLRDQGGSCTWSARSGSCTTIWSAPGPTPPTRPRRTGTSRSSAGNPGTRSACVPTCACSSRCGTSPDATGSGSSTCSSPPAPPAMRSQCMRGCSRPFAGSTGSPTTTSAR